MSIKPILLFFLLLFNVVIMHGCCFDVVWLLHFLCKPNFRIYVKTLGNCTTKITNFGVSVYRMPFHYISGSEGWQYDIGVLNPVPVSLVSSKKPTTTSLQKRHPCLYCEKSFRLKNDLTRHVMTHTGEKPFICSYCYKGFSRKEKLKKHTFTFHTDPALEAHWIIAIICRAEKEKKVFWP